MRKLEPQNQSRSDRITITSISNRPEFGHLNTRITIKSARKTVKTNKHSRKVIKVFKEDLAKCDPAEKSESEIPSTQHILIPSF